jgi:hypothetical protein
MAKTSVAALIAVAVLVGCDQNQNEFTPELFVHGLHAAGGCRPTVSVNRTYAIDEPFSVDFPGASVRMWTATETTGCTHLGEDKYRADDSLCPTYFDTVWLEVAHPDFDTVRGHTVVPGDFEIVWPPDGDTVSLFDSLVWRRSRNAAGYYMSFQFETLAVNLIAPNDSTGGNLDSLYYRLPRLFFLFGYDEGPQTFTLCALDTNYYQWVMAGGFGGGGGGGLDTFRLENGVGVWGSMVARQFSIYYKPDSLSTMSNGGCRVSAEKPGASGPAVPRPWREVSRGRPAWR